MYYGVDENGDIFMTTQKSELTSDYLSDILTDSSLDMPTLEEESKEERDSYILENLPVVDGEQPIADVLPVLDGEQPIADVLPVTESVTIQTADIDYDAISDSMYEAMALAAVNGYEIYPNTQAVNVFTDVLNNIEGDFGYVIISDSSTYTTHLYYSRDYDTSSGSLELRAPVTHCVYSQYRNNSSSPWRYTYTVSDTSDVSFSPTTELIYTNLKSGYPNVVPYKQHTSYFFDLVVAVSVVFIAVRCFFSNGKRGDY